MCCAHTPVSWPRLARPKRVGNTQATHRVAGAPRAPDVAGCSCKLPFLEQCSCPWSALRRCACTRLWPPGLVLQSSGLERRGAQGQPCACGFNKPYVREGISRLLLRRFSQPGCSSLRSGALSGCLLFAPRVMQHTRATLHFWCTGPHKEPARRGSFYNSFLGILNQQAPQCHHSWGYILVPGRDLGAPGAGQ